MTTRETSEPIYGTRILFLFGGDAVESTAAARAWIQREAGEDIGSDASDAKGMTFVSGRHFVVWVKQPEDLRALLHEIIHVGVHLMDFIGHAITADSDEPLAYYCDWLAGEAMG